MFGDPVVRQAAEILDDSYQRECAAHCDEGVNQDYPGALGAFFAEEVCREVKQGKIEKNPVELQEAGVEILREY